MIKENSNTVFTGMKKFEDFFSIPKFYIFFFLNKTFLTEDVWKPFINLPPQIAFFIFESRFEIMYIFFFYNCDTFWRRYLVKFVIKILFGFFFEYLRLIHDVHYIRPNMSLICGVRVADKWRHVNLLQLFLWLCLYFRQREALHFPHQTNFSISKL